MRILAAGGMVIAVAALVAVAVGRARDRQPGAELRAPAEHQPAVTPPVPSPSQAIPPAAAAAPATAVKPPGRPAEAQLMARLRAIKDKDPVAAAALAREGNRRFPDSADAPERASILVHALAAAGQASAARGEAEAMVNHYPDSEWVREVERFSGAHRHRNIRVTDAGELQYR